MPSTVGILFPTFDKSRRGIQYQENPQPTLDDLRQPRPVGRPRNTWEGGVRESLESIGIRQDWQTIAQDRQESRRLVGEIKDPRGL
ncbi:hypothetical protein M8J77_003428 [Diaphorina citri]|nr:hypothetical protein M8J77_003428 [Diaphorina citri]